MLFLIAFLFPSGHFFTQRQALAAWPGVIMLSIVFLVTILSKEVGPPFPSEELAWTVTNPVGFLSASALDVAVTSMMVMLVLMAVGGALSLILRYRGSSVVTKAQIRWMLFSTLVVVGVFLLLVTTNASQQVTGGLLLLVAFTSIPLSMTVAITRYRLFEIDRIISRTVSYSVIVVVLGALFATGVVWLPAALGLEDSPLVVAATTLIVAALFNPLRRRVRNAVDRRFNRSHFEAILVEEQFAARLQQTHNTAEIADVLLKTVGATLGPKMSGLWLNTDDIDATHL
jgi:hypothetical protein